MAGGTVLRVPAAGDIRRWLITPGVLGFIASPRMRSNPHPLYRVLRQVDPMHRSPVGVWLVSGHADVAAALRHPAMGSDESKADVGALNLGPLRLIGRAPVTDGRVPAEAGARGAFMQLLTRLMLFMDAPDHTRIRALVSKAFTPRRVEQLTGRVAELVGDMLDGLADRHAMELLSDFGYPLPARVICELLGVPAEDHRLIVAHAPTLALAFDPQPMRSPAAVAPADRSVSALTEYLDGLIADRRRQPGDDLLSALVAAEAGGDRLTHDELVATVVLLLMAGHETTANLIGNGVLSLLRDPGQLARWRDDPSLDRTAVEELLRFDGPVNMAERITLDTVDLNGTVIPPGRVLVLLLAAANRDRRVFADADRLDLGRDPNPHVSFGGGVHFCLGAALARLEARVAVPALLRRFPTMRLAGPPPRYRPSFTIRGLTALHVAW